MSRRRAVCGQSTADGTPCQNGRGCTVNHQAVPGGPASAMTVAAAGAGPDPLTVGGAAADSAKGLDDVLDRLTVEAGGNAQYRGLLFEPVVIEWLERVDPGTPLGTFTDPTRTDPPPTRGDIAAVHSWGEFATKFPNLAPGGRRDKGIDAVAEMKDGTLIAIQIKTGAKDLTKNDLSKFIAQGTVTPGGVRRYAYQVLIFTNPGMHDEAADLLKNH